MAKWIKNEFEKVLTYENLMKAHNLSKIGKALDRIERQLGVVKFRKTFKTITTDNGAEFRNWKVIEKSYTGSKKARTT